METKNNDENEWIKNVSAQKTTQMSSEELGNILRIRSLNIRKNLSSTIIKDNFSNKNSSLRDLLNFSEFKEKEDEFKIDINSKDNINESEDEAKKLNLKGNNFQNNVNDKINEDKNENSLEEKINSNKNKEENNDENFEKNNDKINKENTNNEDLEKKNNEEEKINKENNNNENIEKTNNQIKNKDKNDNENNESKENKDSKDELEKQNILNNLNTINTINETKNTFFHNLTINSINLELLTRKKKEKEDEEDKLKKEKSIKYDFQNNKKINDSFHLEKFSQINLSIEQKFQMLKKSYKKYYNLKNNNLYIETENEEEDYDNKKIIINPTENNDRDLETLTYFSNNKPNNPFSLNSALLSDKNNNIMINKKSGNNSLRSSSFSYLKELYQENNIFKSHYGKSQFNTIDENQYFNFYNESDDDGDNKRVQSENERKNNNNYIKKIYNDNKNNNNNNNINKSNLKNYQKNSFVVNLNDKKHYIQNTRNKLQFPIKSQNSIKTNDLETKRNEIFKDYNSFQAENPKSNVLKSHIKIESYNENHNNNYMNSLRANYNFNDNKIKEINNKSNNIINYKKMSSFNLYSGKMPIKINNNNYKTLIRNSIIKNTDLIKSNKENLFYKFADNKLKKQLYPPNSVNLKHLNLLK